jgi:hypothetical protein
MKIKHTHLIVFSGLLWLVAGVSLLNLGLKLLTQAQGFSTFFTFFGAKEEGTTLIIATALLLGIVKGKFVLKKSAAQMLTRIYTLPNPVPLVQAYSRRYLVLLAFMMCLGALIKVLGIPNDVRGFIDIAIGAALIQGSTHYFRVLLTEKAI